jgi:hypothetical protein
MFKLTTKNRIFFIGKTRELLLFLKDLSNTYTQIVDVHEAKYNHSS